MKSFLTFLVIVVTTFANAQEQPISLLVKMKPGKRIGQLTDRGLGKNPKKAYKTRFADSALDRWYKIEATQDDKQFAQWLRHKHRDIVDEIVEEISLQTQDTPSNDPIQPWSMAKVSAPAAWDITKGSKQIILSVVDTGIDWLHPDLQGNIWSNTGEIAGNGIDDDSNGYIDDTRGWDFVNNDNDPMDDQGHGTHCAGTTGAVGNNGIGVVGINWVLSIMPVKVLDKTGSGSFTNVTTGIIYAIDNGARPISLSLGGGGPINYPPMVDVQKYAEAHNAILIVAAGNSNQDALNSVPANVDDVISVGATTELDVKAGFSNHTHNMVSAPGTNIPSCRAKGTNLYGDLNHFIPAGDTSSQYYLLNGTSMSTPLVAGEVALLLSKYPELTPGEVRQVVKHGTDDLGAIGQDASFGWGRINALRTLQAAQVGVLSPNLSNLPSATTITGSYAILGTITGNGLAGWKLEYGGFSGWTQMVVGTSSTINVTYNTGLIPDGLTGIRLVAIHTDGREFVCERFNITVDNLDLEITSPWQPLITAGLIQISGIIVPKSGLVISGYTLDYGVGDNPASFNRIASGSAPFTGVLGTWDTKGFTDGTNYTLRLTASNGVETRRTVKLDTMLVPGYPILLHHVTSDYKTRHQSIPNNVPILKDLNIDGVEDYIGAGGKTVVLNGVVVLTDSVIEGVAATDLDGDGKSEIIVSSRHTSSYYPTLKILRSDGTLKTIFSELLKSGTPAVFDLNGDGLPEMIYLNAYNRMQAVNINGQSAPGFPVTELGASPVGTGLTAMPHVAVNKNGMLATMNGLSTMKAFSRTGQVLWNLLLPPIETKPVVGCVPIFADTDGDGIEELFVVTNVWTCGSCYKSQLHAIEAATGTITASFDLPNYGSGGYAEPPAGVVLDKGFHEVIVNVFGKIFRYTKNGLSAPYFSSPAPSTSIFNSVAAYRASDGMTNFLWTEARGRVVCMSFDGQTQFVRESRTGSSPYGYAFMSSAMSAGRTAFGLTTSYAVALAPNGTYFYFDNLSFYLWKIPNGQALEPWSQHRNNPAQSGSSPVNGVPDPPTPRPDAPILSSPPNGTQGLSAGTIEFLWTGQGASSYRFQLSSNSSFGTVLVDRLTISPSTTVTSLSEGTIYYWRVQAQASGGTSDWSAIYTFSTQSATPTPVNQAPTVTISFPIDGSTVPRKSSIYILVKATDDVKVVKTVLYINGIQTSSVATGGDLKFPWRVPNAPNKIISIQVIATDEAGLTGMATSRVTTK